MAYFGLLISGTKRQRNGQLIMLILPLTIFSSHPRHGCLGPLWSAVWKQMGAYKGLEDLNHLLSWSLLHFAPSDYAAFFPLLVFTRNRIW